MHGSLKDSRFFVVGAAGIGLAVATADAKASVEALEQLGAGINVVVSVTDSDAIAVAPGIVPLRVGDRNIEVELGGRRPARRASRSPLG